MIELLVVLVIIGVLSLAAISQITPRSPKAVRAALGEIKFNLQQARQIAISSGKDIHIQIASGNSNFSFKVYDATPNTVSASTIPLMDAGFGKDWSRYAAVTITDPPVSEAGGSAMHDISALTAFGFSSTLPTGISMPSPSGGPFLGFSANGTPQSVTNAGVRTTLSGGTWVAVKGLSPNLKGYPYGAVFISSNGFIIAYYKGDSQTAASTDPWIRVE